MDMSSFDLHLERVSIQPPKERLPFKAVRILVNAENSFAIILVEPSMPRAWESVNVTVAMSCVDEGRLSGSGGAVEVEAPNCPPVWRLRESCTSVFDASSELDGKLRVVLDNCPPTRTFFDSLDESDKICSCTLSGWLSNSPRSVHPCVLFRGIGNGLLLGATSGFHVGTASQRKSGCTL